MHAPIMPSASTAFAESLAPVEQCLNLESARALLELPVNSRVQARVDLLAEKCNQGSITREERSEYEALVWADQFLGILQAKAEHYLKTHGAA
jgi:hypothetical protein